MYPAVYVSWLPVVSRKTFSEVGHDYRRHCGISDDGSGKPAVVSSDMVDDLDELFG